MEAELRIVDEPLVDMRSQNEMEADRNSNCDEEASPQDLRVVRTCSPTPITLSLPDTMTSTPRLDEAKSAGSNLPPNPPVGASRKRKNTTPTQDRRAKWLFGDDSPRLAPAMAQTAPPPPPPPLSPAVNGRPRAMEENGSEFQLVQGFTPVITSEVPAHSSSPVPLPAHPNSAPASVPGPDVSDDGDEAPGMGEDEELTELMCKMTRFEQQLRQDLTDAVSRFCRDTKTSVRQSVTSLHARNLATLSAAAAAAANPALTPSGLHSGPPLPQLADINGNPALFNLKEVSKNMEQLMLASQCLPYRFIAAAAAANANRMAPPQMPYPPMSTPGGPGLLNPLLNQSAAHMSLAFPMPTSICDSPEGLTGADSDEGGDGDSPLNMSKKKRTKVTDNHLRNFAGLDVTGVLPAALESMGVGMFNNITVSTPQVVTPITTPTPNVSLTSSPLRGPSTSFTDLSSTTLTPVHLRKAKLMFFYTRYPNSNVLKVYFPDVKFNKHNTAQIVKWFSNFREFYYIQIEKFARQAIAEGVQEADEMAIVAECDLIRTLNTHYNRNNQIPVPPHFITVVEVTVREFFKALVSHKDQDHSWKKPIYKVIARYDQAVPEDFKNSNWIDHMDS